MAGPKNEKTADTTLGVGPTPVVATPAMDDRAELLQRISSVEKERDQARVERDVARMESDDARTARDKVEEELLELRTAPPMTRGRFTEFQESFAGRVRLRALRHVGLAVRGERLDVAPGDVFEACKEECAGLTFGEHFELARGEDIES